MLRKLIPGFLKKADHYLLTNHPILWKTKIHYVAFYSLFLGNLAAVGLAYAYPLAVDSIPTAETVQVLFAITCALCLFAAIWYAFEQRKYSLRAISPSKQVLAIPLFMICLSSFVFNAGLFQDTLLTRIAHILSDEAYKADEPQLEHIMTYTFTVDNYTQYNLNNRELVAISAKYGYPNIKYGYERNFPEGNRKKIKELSSRIQTLNASKRYDKEFNASNFLGFFDLSTDCYYNPTSFLSAHMSGFWSYSIFLVPVFSILIFLLTQAGVVAVGGLLFCSFLTFIALLFLGRQSGLDVETYVYLLLPFLAIIPFIFKKNSRKVWLISGVSILLFSTLSLGASMANLDPGHDLLKVFLLSFLLLAIVAVFYSQLKKEKLPQTV